MQIPSTRPAAFLASLLALATLVAAPAAQLRGLPQKSPHARVEQTVGATELSVDYHRPAVRGRAIWGELVPWDAVWRAGANDTTVFATSDPITIEGEPLPAGRYGLHVLPSRDKWTLILNHVADSWGSYSYDQAQDALRIEVAPRAVPHTEWLTFEFQELADDGATLVLRWEERALAVRIGVDVSAATLRRIEAELAASPTPQNKVEAARWCLGAGVAQAEALDWVSEALEAERSFTGYVVKAGLLDEAGRKDEAEAELEHALQLEPAPQPNQMARLGMELSALGKHALAIRLLYPASDALRRSSAVWSALATSLEALGYKDEALAAYASALESARSEQEAARIREASAKLQGS